MYKIRKNSLSLQMIKVKKSLSLLFINPATINVTGSKYKYKTSL